MRFDPETFAVDWQGFWTFLLTLLVAVGGLGLPVLLAFWRALTIARQGMPPIRPQSCLLVFGKRLEAGAIDREYRQRLDRAAGLIAAAPERLTLLLGGPPAQGGPSEAEAGGRYLRSLGVANRGNILLEQTSRNTLENLRQARSILRVQPPMPVVLISNRYHLARCGLIADSLGMPHVLCAAETNRWRLDSRLAGKLALEALYMLWFATGKAWARLTRNQRMLQRVS